MKARYWSLAIILLLVNYLIFAALFSRLTAPNFVSNYTTRTPVPTFTPAPALPAFVIPTLPPATVEPTPTATPVLTPTPAAVNGSPVSEAASAQAEEAGTNNSAQVVSSGTVNIRSGPGTNYPVIGALEANVSLPIVGRNPDASWWQIKMADETLGWVANTVVNATNADEVPVAEAPPPPAAAVPAAAAAQAEADDSPEPPPDKPKYQYEPTGWYDDGNAGLTRFLGTITDVNGNPVNGTFVQASCGDYSTISYPSGPVGWGSLNVSADWPPGFYDIVVDDKPVPCMWVLTVVDTDDRKTVKGVLSESIPIQITAQKSIVTANWRKNW